MSKPEATSDDWYRSIGSLVVHFERACVHARDVVQVFVRGDDDKVAVGLSYLGPRELAETIRTLRERAGMFRVEESTVEEFEYLIDKVNRIVSGVWFVGENDKEAVTALWQVGPNPERTPRSWDDRSLTFDELVTAVSIAKRVSHNLKLLAIKVGEANATAT